jgi:hypothetical protein
MAGNFAMAWDDYQRAGPSGVREFVMASAANTRPAFAQQSGDDPPRVGFHMGILANAHDNAY